MIYRENQYFLSVRPGLMAVLWILIYSISQNLLAQNQVYDFEVRLPFVEFQADEVGRDVPHGQIPQNRKMLLYEQVLDSLKRENDLENLADTYIRMVEDKDYAPGFITKDSLLHEALRIRLGLESPRDIMNTYNQLFFLSFNTGNSKEALDYANQALAIALEHDYSKSAAIIYSNIALMYIKMGDYEKANEFNYRALRYFQELKDTLQMARSKLSIGQVNIMLEDYDKALLNITQAKDEFRMIDNRHGYSISLTNIGLIHHNLKDYKLALRYFFEAVQIDEQNKDSHGIASNYNSIGKAYYKLDNIEKSLRFLNQAHEIYQKSGDKSGLGSVYLNLAKVYTKRNGLQKALEYCERSIRLFEQTNEPASRRNALEQLSLIHQKLGNYQLALDIFHQASVLKDSLFNIDKAAKVSMIEEKYINEKLTNDNLNLRYSSELQQLKLKSQKSLNRVYLIALITLVIGMVVIVVQFRKKNLAYKFITKKNLDLIKKEQELKKAREQMIGLTETDRNKPSLDPDEKEAILQRMDKLLEHDLIFTRPDLTIEKLAHRLATNRTYLSQIINEVFGKSYSTFVNEYRVAHAMKMLSDPEIGSKYSIDAIARDAGFNSISNFNMVFKKLSGVTPSVFIKNIDVQDVTLDDNDS